MEGKKTILVTGANGFLAWELLHQLCKCGEYNIIAMTSDSAKAKENYADLDVTCVSNDDVFNKTEYLEATDIIVHAAFCRKSRGNHLVESLYFSKEIFVLARKLGVKGIINISTQAVYGQDEGVLPDETISMNPGYLYALAKSASEILLETIMESEEDSPSMMCRCTNIRLASLIGPSNTIPDNVLKKFVDNALEGKSIRIVGGEQKFSFLDVRDAASAICRLIDVDVFSWKKEYNLGNNYQMNIVDMAREINSCMAAMNKPEVDIIIEPSDIQLNAGMNCAMIYQDLNWKPGHSFRNTIEDCIKYEISSVK
ncbi:NAD dependent epimerase/dehydratase family protein [Desulfosporosinus youngiae DSM 17734]|uniref:NAD dependent epimerase/dehydratase family protein n=2 Tax=Desulfosporosinus TaxID=79206 RepID=H5XZF7_9FIRM|nr:NAD dependent epimerase/dehydratase family protein [Desulfosporosinus youngiae DSM 17734]